MKLIPYQRVTITTDLSKDEVVKRLRDRVGPKKRENFVRIDKNIFSGQITDDKFNLKLITDYRNSWTPDIEGNIIQTDKSTELTVILKSNWFLIIFTALFMILGLAILTDEIINFDNVKTLNGWVYYSYYFPTDFFGLVSILTLTNQLMD